MYVCIDPSLVTCRVYLLLLLICKNSMILNLSHLHQSTDLPVDNKQYTDQTVPDELRRSSLLID
jgi:hypothetical protein